MYERSLKGLLDYGIQSDECKDEKEIYECVKSLYDTFISTHDYMCLNDEDLISGFESILYSDEKDYKVIEIKKSKNQDIHWFKFDDNVIKCDFYSVLVSRNKKVFRLFPLYLDLSLESKNQPVTLHETTEAKIRRKALLSN